jgi:hypothetical protein
MQHTGRFIRFPVITNIYNKKTKGATVMEFFTATGKRKKRFFFENWRCSIWHHGWHGTHLYDIQVLATHASTRAHRYSSLLQWSAPLGQRGYVAIVKRVRLIITTLWNSRYIPLVIQWNLGSRTPLFTNNSVHEQTFRAKKVSHDERCLGLRTRKLATEASWEYRCGSVSCWLTNLVSVHEHFGSRTASRNELSSWTEVPLYFKWFERWHDTSELHSLPHRSSKSGKGLHTVVVRGVVAGIAIIILPS